MKQISVSSIAALDGFNQPYLRLVSVANDKGYKTRVELDAKAKSGKLGRAVKTLKDTRGESAENQSTYDLIMRDKERLLSFEEPLRFILTHSALEEGWDNPNVFQVCTPLEQSSTLSARQKIGRGLRLCVNQQGERVDDRQINTLHVIASEPFVEFAGNLQREIEKETGVRFGTLDITSFIDIDVPVEAAEQLGLPVPLFSLASSCRGSGDVMPKEERSAALKPCGDFMKSSMEVSS